MRNIPEARLKSKKSLDKQLPENIMDSMDNCFTLRSSLSAEHGDVIDMMLKSQGYISCSLKPIMEALPIGVVITDVEGNITHINNTACSILEWHNEGYKLPHYLHILPNLLKQTEEVLNEEVHIRRKNGHEVFIQVSRSPIYVGERVLIGSIATLQDITAKKNAEIELKRLAAIVEYSHDSIVSVDFEGVITSWNPGAQRLYGYTQEEMKGNTMECVLLPENKNEIFHMIDIIKNGGKVEHFETKRIKRNGEVFYVSLSVSPIKTDDSKIIGVSLVARDITGKKMAEEELQRAREAAEVLAQTDFLTGILNRRAFNGRLDDELAKRLREKSSLCLVLADIDHFKKVNDVYGHNIGDLVLQQFAKCLSGLCRQYDFIGRHGGEEFLICLPNTTCMQAKVVAERMRKAAEDMLISLPAGGEIIKITASFGVAKIEDDEQLDINTLIAQADSAMYSAKQSGRNRVKTICEI